MDCAVSGRAATVGDPERRGKLNMHSTADGAKTRLCTPTLGKGAEGGLEPPVRLSVVVDLQNAR